VWIDDVVHALLDVAGLEHWDGPVNIGGGQGVSVIELAGMIKGIYGPDIKVEIQPARDIEVTRFIADLRKMRSTLGWIPELPSLRHLRDVAVSTGKTT
jgi:UDP-glucose 4-epimerase